MCFDLPSVVLVIYAQNCCANTSPVDVETLLSTQAKIHCTWNVRIHHLDICDRGGKGRSGHQPRSPTTSSGVRVGVGVGDGDGVIVVGWQFFIA